MAKFTCVCGTTISTSGTIPNGDEWHFLSDVEFDSISGQVDAEDIYRRTNVFYKCPVSGHLWFFWDGLDGTPSMYEPVETPAGPGRPTEHLTQ